MPLDQAVAFESHERGGDCGVAMETDGHGNRRPRVIGRIAEEIEDLTTQPATGGPERGASFPGRPFPGRPFPGRPFPGRPFPDGPFPGDPARAWIERQAPCGRHA